MKNGNYEFDGSGLFNNLHDALDALHEMSIVIGELLSTSVAEDEDETVVIADLLDPEFLSALEAVSASMHFHSCLEARESGAVRADGTFDATKIPPHRKEDLTPDGVVEEELIPLNESPAQVPNSMRNFLNDLLEKKGY